MRFVFLDEGGISSHEPVAVVAGVVVQADEQLIPLERALERLKRKHIPEEHWDDFVFHAKEIWSGTGKIFGDRDAWTLDRRLFILRDLIRVIKKLDLPVVHEAYSREGATVAAAPTSPRLTAFRCADVPRRLAVRCNLLDVFQAQQHLIFRQRLCPPAKPMPLQFLDDLTQPFALAPLGEQHRFQHLGIVRQGVVHTQIRTYSPPSGDAFDASDSLRRSAANKLSGLCWRRRLPCFMHKPPVEPLQQRRQLRRRQAHHTVLNLRPAEDSILEPLGEQAQTRSVPEHQLDPIRPLGPEHIDSSREGIGPHALAHQGRKPFHPLTEVYRFGRHHHPDRTRRADHRLTFSAWTIDAIIVGSAPRPARIVMPSTSISMIPASALALQRIALRSRPRADAGTTASTTAGTNCTSAASEGPPAASRN